MEKKTRRYETISWKSYYNILCKRKWRLFGEQQSDIVETESTEQEQPQKKRRKRRQQLTRPTPSTPRTRPTPPMLPSPAAEKDEFMAAFAGVESLQCSLGTRCMNRHIEGYQKCYRTGCNGEIHHLCAIQNNLLDTENELNVFCSIECKTDS